MYVHVKSMIKLLAESPGLSIYAIARRLRVGDSSVYYPLHRLREAGVATESNELTDLGHRLFRLIEASGSGIDREECVRHFGLEAVKTGRQLRILSEKRSVVTVTEIKDPSPSEVLLEEMRSAESDFAVSMVPFNKWFAGWFRPSQILLSPELSWEEKVELLGTWYGEYWPEVHTILGIAGPLAPVVGTIIVSETNKSRALR